MRGPFRATANRHRPAHRTGVRDGTDLGGRPSGQSGRTSGSSDHDGSGGRTSHVQHYRQRSTTGSGGPSGARGTRNGTSLPLHDAENIPRSSSRAHSGRRSQLTSIAHLLLPRADRCRSSRVSPQWSQHRSVSSSELTTCGMRLSNIVSRTVKGRSGVQRRRHPVRMASQPAVRSVQGSAFRLTPEAPGPDVAPVVAQSSQTLEASRFTSDELDETCLVRRAFPNSGNEAATASYQKVRSGQRTRRVGRWHGTRDECPRLPERSVDHRRRESAAHGRNAGRLTTVFCQHGRRGRWLIFANCVHRSSWQAVALCMLRGTDLALTPGATRPGDSQRVFSGSPWAATPDP